MKIQLIRNDSCHIWQTAENELKKALREAGLRQDYEIVVVKSDDEAKKYRFFGSPQITIDGRDIDASAGKVSQFQTKGCRFYMWPPAQRASGSARKMYEYPPSEMILQALKQVV